MDWPITVFIQLSKDLFCIQGREMFSGGVKSQLVFRGTVDLKQVQGSVMEGIREQSSQDFYKFCDFKTRKSLLFRI